MARKLGILGGSGLYEIEGLQGAAWTEVETPWGKPSDAFFTGSLNGLDLVFLPRHGSGHVHAPGDVPYRANIDAMKRLGVTDILSISACGSFREEMAPGDFVAIDQFIDRTVGRPSSFFGSGCVAHVSMAHPTCPRLARAAVAAAREAGATVHEGGTYLAMEGPQFSSLAESRMYRESWGADIIGMTNMPEAKLAREAEICFLTLAMVTDYDSWHPDHGSVDIREILATLAANAGHAKGTVAAMPGLLDHETPCPHGCDRALEHAIMTKPAARDPALLAKLSAVAGRVLEA
ncbi:S-methyl-5'-thioadenosine phosphorylase [Pseudoroseicyclus tamaricis]|uniref:S-methyl-5'-thioadenosine phosphorylase n=1 Tax=Pseudoroseicyclus tamaricis TaxID=2705421 RepID=A0A6B2K0B9_9RHOB|nr:S-methyl-5'-thioadenosine phosphorylase [Pseudoroseicyclus tamaricis]NDV01894.1 S-methyl-5'-thioadenosine phosphorylase [Pseudoroseicyclus tamaricis]